MMSNKVYPKVLILCERFDNCTGMGVTLTNLFKDWPAERLALAGFGIDRCLCDEIRPCKAYFALDGKFVVKRRQPAGIKEPSLIRRFLKSVYTKAGASDFKTIPLTEDLKQFISDFKPDVIFTALGDIRRIKFARAVSDYYPAAKLALYIVDDWPDSRFNGRWFEGLWRRRYSKCTAGIVGRADIRLSICQKMSDVYLQRYGAEFIPFHNPVDVDSWRQVDRSAVYGDSFSIVYVGKINRDTEPSLKALGECVDSMARAGKDVRFDIYSPSPTPVELTGLMNVSVKGAVPNCDIPSLLKSYSALFLTLGFSEETMKYVKLSMPTKLTEYLASETPILLYAPADIALTEYLSEHNAAVVCTRQDGLMAALEHLLCHDEDVEAIASNQSKLVRLHDIGIVREAFRKAISQEY